MKTIIPIVLFSFILISCESIKKTVRESYRYEMYIDFKNVSYQGQNATQRLYFEIDSVNGMWYYGKLVINKNITYAVHGFEKGGHYVTTYKIPEVGDYGRLEIWCIGETGQIRESLTIIDPDLGKGIVKEKTVLYRQPRKICH